MQTTTCPTRHRQALIEFMKDHPGCQVRDVKLCTKNPLPATRLEGCKQFPQLRTKKHNHLALAIDELGNAFVLTNTGVRLNLLKGEF